MKVLVVGASRGIGLEFATQFAQAGAAVTATARNGDALQRLRKLGAVALTFDVLHEQAASTLSTQLQGQAFDLVIVNAGVFGPRTAGLDAPSQADFDAVMHTNVLGAMRVLSVLPPLLAPQARVAVISSDMGRISGRSGHQGWLYRASKAALNSVLKDVSQVMQGQAVCVALHPGWVRTDMGGEGGALDVADSVGQMRQTLAGLEAADNGGFFNHDGQALAW